MGSFTITTTIISTLLIISCVTEKSIPSCDSPVYCQGDLLDTVQRARPFDDSKTFVDMKMKNTVQTTLDNFNVFKKANQNPTKAQIRQFVEENFEEGGEFDDWTPADYTDTPKLLERITDPTMEAFAGDLVKIWKTLARKVKQEVFDHSDQYSLIPVPNGFMIPGGRFREFYYWDSYWIIRGLLQSDMDDTARGMLENFIYIVKQYGFIPNGARVYYLNRSQPPLLTAMVNQYVRKTKNFDFLRENVQFLDQELSWWLENRMTTVTKLGQKYKMARYDVESPSPRPESYWEDISTASFYENETERGSVYCDLKSGAESGLDFSSRWIIDSQGSTEANLTFIKTRDVIPVDLNSILSQAFKIVSDFYLMLNNIEKHVYWLEESTSLQKSIEKVLYDRLAGIWYDYDLINNEPRKNFYPTNFAPLWADAIDPLRSEVYGRKAAKYLQEMDILSYKGGIPTSLIHNGEQWDFPNAWPPLQAFVVWGLHKSGSCEAREVAKELGTNWVQANHLGFSQKQEMFEKYDAVVPGAYGGGGEYKVQSGFGWTNGVVLDFIDLYYTNATK